MFFAGLFRFMLTAGLLVLLGLGIYDYLKNFDENECSMTYMREPPGIIPVNLPSSIQGQFPNYKLYFYCEGYDCQMYEKLRFNQAGHIPVLFIPGNADSHMQVRSMASIGLDKSRKPKYSKLNIKFHYFTISFNEELSALYGPLLEIQTKYAKHCIQHILTLFEGIKPEFKRPKSVLIIGNSMGGIISRGLFQDDNFNDQNLVHTILTKSSPHNRPVINIDKHLSDYYYKTNQFWLKKENKKLDNVVLASLYGGTRDILVRSGLANLNEWKEKSNAAIISSYTVSMPHVWRSIDHRCMAWCRELVMALNRALFDLVDPNTMQIYEERKVREKILRYHLERDIYTYQENSVSNLEFNSNVIEIIDEKPKMFFEFNDYNEEEKHYLFDLNKLVDDNYDSLFIYTNINEKNSFLLCKQFKRLGGPHDLNECSSYKDLMIENGRSIPPYIEGYQKQSTLKTINVLNINKLISNEKYSYLVLKLPLLSNKKANKYVHQLVVKFDWYLRVQRVKSLNTMPNLFDLKTSLKLSDSEPSSSNFVFQRFYLPQMSNLFQVFNLRKNSKSTCDEYLLKLMNNKQETMKPLGVSTLMIQFIEPVDSIQSKQMNEYIYHSQAIQTKNKNLTIFLSKNTHMEIESIPFIDVIKFDIQHLLHKAAQSSQKQKNNLDKCSNVNNLELELNLSSILGQFIRFYVIYVPAFLVCILQIFDYLFLKVNLNKETNQSYNSFFILNKTLTNFRYHVQFSIFMTILNYLFQSDYMHLIYGYVDPTRMYIIENDFEKLNQEKISHWILPFVLYWCAYVILSISCFFLSFVYGVYSLIVNMIILKIFAFLNNPYIQYILIAIHLVVTFASGLLVSTLTHICLFYGSIIRLAVNNPKFHKKDQDQISYLKFSTEQTRLLLNHFILALNLAPLLVWIKSIDIAELQQISTLNSISYDSYLIAFLNAFIYFMYYFKNKISILEKKIFFLSSKYLANLVIINSLLTILYSSVSIYRLQYFILIHLFLMNFNSIKSNFVLKNEKKTKSE